MIFKLLERRPRIPTILRYQCNSNHALRAPMSTTPQSSTTKQFKTYIKYREMKDLHKEYRQSIQNRKMANYVNFDRVLQLYDKLVSHSAQLNDLRKQRNSNSQTMKDLMKRLKETKIREKGEDEYESLESQKAELIQRGSRLRQEIEAQEIIEKELAQELHFEAKYVPNLIHEDTPLGDESKAILVEMVGPQRPETEFKPLDHMELANLHDMVDINRAGKVAASRFYYLKNAATFLELALTRYAMDVCAKRGFTAMIAPDVIRTEVLEGCGFSPRSSDPQTYFLSTRMGNESSDPTLCLTATAEFPLAAMYADETLTTQSPIKMVASGHAFRAEGLAGSTNRGLYRVHQFTKVEMFALCHEHQSEDVFREFIDIQKEIFSGLEITFRILNMPTEELGAPAFKKYDMEAWMPGRQEWGEISSTSNCTDFQTQRLRIRVLDKETGSFKLMHTVNGTACAIPRMIIALLETHQQKDRSIYIPKKLRRYLFGESVTHLKPDQRTYSV